jgi:hypothetical protein
MSSLPKDGFVSRRSLINGPYQVLPMSVADPGEAAMDLLDGYAWGPALGYLMRRFGPPNMASDPDREIAAWLITTPDPDVHVVCSAAASDYVSARFRAIASEEIAHELIRLGFAQDDGGRIERIGSAIRRTIADLLRTVSVRDVDISILGEADARSGHLVPARQSGAALPDFAYVEDAFRLYGEIEAMGGDPAALRRATRILKDRPLRGGSATA